MSEQNGHGWVDKGAEDAYHQAQRDELARFTKELRTGLRRGLSLNGNAPSRSRLMLASRIVQVAKGFDARQFEIRLNTLGIPVPRGPYLDVTLQELDSVCTEFEGKYGDVYPEADLTPVAPDAATLRDAYQTVVARWFQPCDVGPRAAGELDLEAAFQSMMTEDDAEGSEIRGLLSWLGRVFARYQEA